MQQILRLRHFICSRLQEKKSFGKRVSLLAKRAGVPWEVAVFAGQVADDNEAVNILKAIKLAKNNITEDLSYELSYGINRRVDALSKVLGTTWEKLNCKGQRQTSTLASYLCKEPV